MFRRQMKTAIKMPKATVIKIPTEVAEGVLASFIATLIFLMTRLGRISRMLGTTDSTQIASSRLRPGDFPALTLLS